MKVKPTECFGFKTPQSGGKFIVLINSHSVHHHKTYSISKMYCRPYFLIFIICEFSHWKCSLKLLLFIDIHYSIQHVDISYTIRLFDSLKYRYANKTIACSVQLKIQFLLEHLKTKEVSRKCCRSAISLNLPGKLIEVQSRSTVCSYLGGIAWHVWFVALIFWSMARYSIKKEMTKYEIIEFVWFDHPSNINVIHIIGEAVSFMAIVNESLWGVLMIYKYSVLIPFKYFI